MARPREFDVDKVLDAAMAAFWTKGYEATSLADLTSAMGLSKSSFYKAFGSKRALFLTIMDRYGETVAAPHIRACLMRYEDAFLAVLTRARDSGEFTPARDVRAMAWLLTASLLGLYIAAQAGAGRDALNDIADGALASLA